jgi:hypothetical protein
MFSLHQYAEVYPHNCSVNSPELIKTKDSETEPENYGLLFEDSFLCLTLLSLALKMVF